jgi:hypothetical protein
MLWNTSPLHHLPVLQCVIGGLSKCSAPSQHVAIQHAQNAWNMRQVVVPKCVCVYVCEQEEVKSQY